MIRRILVASFLLCAVAFAQPPQGGPGRNDGPRGKFEHHGGPGGEMRGILPPGRWWKDAEVVKAIGLNGGQVQKIEQVFQDSRMKLVDMHAFLQKEELKLEPLLEADNPAESDVLTAIDRIAAGRATLEKENARMAFAIRRVLTPEQWKKLCDLHPHHDHFPPPAGGPHANLRPQSQADGREHGGGNPPPPPPPGDVQENVPEPSK